MFNEGSKNISSHEKSGFSQEDIARAQAEYDEAIEKYNAIDFGADDYDEDSAREIQKDFEQKRAKFHEIKSALGSSESPEVNQQ